MEWQTLPTSGTDCATQGKQGPCFNNMKKGTEVKFFCGS